MDTDQWEDIGVLSRHQLAHYHGFETTLTLYGRSYGETLVVHSSAYDGSKRGRLERPIKRLPEAIEHFKNVRYEFSDLQRQKLNYRSFISDNSKNIGIF